MDGKTAFSTAAPSKICAQEILLTLFAPDRNTPVFTGENNRPVGLPEEQPLGTIVIKSGTAQIRHRRSPRKRRQTYQRVGDMARYDEPQASNRRTDPKNEAISFSILLTGTVLALAANGGSGRPLGPHPIGKQQTSQRHKQTPTLRTSCARIAGSYRRKCQKPGAAPTTLPASQINIPKPAIQQPWPGTVQPVSRAYTQDED